MGKSAVIVSVAIVGLGVGGWLAYNSLAPKTSSIASVRDVMPADVVYYAEAHDLATTLAAAQGTEAWSDLSSSVLVRDGDSPLHLALQTLRDASDKIQYPLDETNLPKFIGQDVAFGVRLDGVLTRAEWVAVTRLDVNALAKDLLVGKLDWQALEAELHARSQKADVAVSVTEYKGYRIAQMSRGVHVAHVVIMEDLLAVAGTPRMLERVVDLRLAGGAGGLSSVPKFSAEMALVDKDSLLRDWVDLERVDALRGVAAACWNASFGSGGNDAPPWMFDGVLDATRGRPSLARAVTLPGGDLYRMHWTWSRTDDDIFADDTHGDVGAVVEDDALMYGEMRDIGAVVEAWNTSNLKKGLLESELAKWVGELTDDPAGAASSLEAMLPMRRGAFSRGAPNFDGSLQFFLRFGWHAFEQGVRSMFGGDGAIAMYVREGNDVPAFVGMMRLGVDGRLALHAILDGMTKSQNPSLLRVREIDGRAVYSNSDTDTRVVLVGDAVIWGNDADRLERVVRRLSSGKAPDSDIARAARESDPGRCLYVQVASQKLGELFAADRNLKRLGFAGGQMEEMTRGVLAESYTMTVAPHFENVKIKLHSRFDPEIQDSFMRRTLSYLHQGVSATRASATDDTILHMATFLDIPGFVDLMGGFVDQEAFDKALEGMREEFGIDVRRELLPALGRELAFEVDRNLDRSDPEAPPIPGVLLSLGVRDAAPVDKMLKAVADSLERDFDRQQQRRGSARGSVQREALADGVLYVVDMGGLPVKPTFGRVGQFVRIGLTERPVRQRIRTAPSTASFTSKPAVRRALETVGEESTFSMVIDFGAVVDQIQVYTKDLAEAFSGQPDGVDDIPDDLDEDEWMRRYEELQTEHREKAGGRAQRVTKALDVLRLLDFIAASGYPVPDGNEAVWTYGFK